MSNSISTITSKWQVTIPKQVRKGIALSVGQRIVWEIEGDKLVARRVRSVGELAGCFKSAVPVKPKDYSGALGEAAIDRHQRISKQKR